MRAQVPIVWLFVVLMSPVAWPISKLLDRLLGREISAVLSRYVHGMLEHAPRACVHTASPHVHGMCIARAWRAHSSMLLELININLEETHKGSGLTQDDGKLLKGALTFKDRTVGPPPTSMTPSSSCACAHMHPMHMCPCASSRVWHVCMACARRWATS